MHIQAGDGHAPPHIVGKTRAQQRYPMAGMNGHSRHVACYNSMKLHLFPLNFLKVIFSCKSTQDIRIYANFAKLNPTDEREKYI